MQFTKSFLRCQVADIQISINVSAQDTTTVYFDKMWKKTPKESAYYYRKIVKKAKEEYLVQDYYPNKIPQMTGTFTSKRCKNKEGKFTYYHENGKKLSEGVFHNNKPVGEWSGWHDNGLIESKRKYNEVGLATGFWQEWYPDGTVKDEGNYINGKKQDEWKWYFENGQVSSREIYNEDKLDKIEFWDENGKKVEGQLETLIKPQFVGGDAALMKYVAENVHYPFAAQRKGIQGTVYIRFVVGKDGFVKDAEIFRSANPLIDFEALRVVKNMPKWIPGKTHNIPENVYFIIPVKFKLE
jgi:TonB family protein